MDCVFCKIIKGEIPADIILKDANVVVFKDISPRAPIHWLIVPKLHIGSIKGEGSEDIAKILIVKAKELAQQKNIPAFKLVFNVGKEAGQTVEHLHLHFLAGGPSELKI